MLAQHGLALQIKNPKKTDNNCSFSIMSIVCRVVSGVVLKEPSVHIQVLNTPKAHIMKLYLWFCDMAFHTINRGFVLSLLLRHLAALAGQ